MARADYLRSGAGAGGIAGQNRRRGGAGGQLCGGWLSDDDTALCAIGAERWRGRCDLDRFGNGRAEHGARRGEQLSVRQRAGDAGGRCARDCGWRHQDQLCSRLERIFGLSAERREVFPSRSAVGVRQYQCGRYRQLHAAGEIWAPTLGTLVVAENIGLVGPLVDRTAADLREPNRLTAWNPGRRNGGAHTARPVIGR